MRIECLPLLEAGTITACDTRPDLYPGSLRIDSRIHGFTPADREPARQRQTVTPRRAVEVSCPLAHNNSVALDLERPRPFFRAQDEDGRLRRWALALRE